MRPIQDNDVYSTGFFRGTADFDPGDGTLHTTASSTATYIPHYFVWTLGTDWPQAGGPSPRVAVLGGTGSMPSFEDRQIAVRSVGDADDGVYTVGSFASLNDVASWVDFDPHPTNSAALDPGLGTDGYISKLGLEGQYRWAVQVGGFNAANPTQPVGPCALNCINDKEIYAFHMGGANVVMADGSVRFLKANVKLDVVLQLLTRARGEVVNVDF